MERPQYIDWLITEEGISLNDGSPITCFRIDYSDDESILDQWALHIRRHYINDEDLCESIDIYGTDVESYLRKHIIPQKGDDLGPTARSGDITEILIADLLEYIMGYSVPRYKQMNRSGISNSEHGTDVIGYKFISADKIPNSNDELIAAEVKAALTSNDYTPIKKAIIDSQKDEERLAHTIDYCRKKLKYLGNKVQSEEIKRFSFKPENDYKIVYMAAGVSSRETVDMVIKFTDDEKVVINCNQSVFYIHGKRLMELAHNIYERCIR